MTTSPRTLTFTLTLSELEDPALIARLAPLNKFERGALVRRWLRQGEAGVAPATTPVALPNPASEVPDNGNLPDWANASAPSYGS